VRSVESFGPFASGDRLCKRANRAASPRQDRLSSEGGLIPRFASMSPPVRSRYALTTRSVGKGRARRVRVYRGKVWVANPVAVHDLHWSLRGQGRGAADSDLGGSVLSVGARGS
jgi:hypothetical protein